MPASFVCSFENSPPNRHCEPAETAKQSPLWQTGDCFGANAPRNDDPVSLLGGPPVRAGGLPTEPSRVRLGQELRRV